MVRSAVISLLKDMNQPMLAKLSPLSQSAISNIANWKYHGNLSTDKCKDFGEWFKRYKAEKNKAKEMTFDTTKESRLTFHADYEIPIMRKWYNETKNPSDEKLYFYAKELNKGCIRQERPLVTVAKLRNWWKNEKQREKRLSTHVSRKLEAVPPSFRNVDGDVFSKRTRSGKRLKVEEQTIGDLLLSCIQTTETNAGRDFRGAGSDPLLGSVHSTETSPSVEIRRAGTAKDNQEEDSSEGKKQAQHLGINFESNSIQSGTYPTSSAGYNPQPAFDSHFHSTGSSDAENGNQVVLSDGTVVRAVSLLSPVLNKTENQGE